MFNFDLHLPTKILFGAGQIANIRQYIPENARILLAYGGGSIKQNGVFEQVSKVIEGLVCYEFSGIEPNPKYETLIKAVELVKTQQLNFILAVGGGSVIDGCKFISAAAHYEGDYWDILALKQPELIKSAVKIGAILTLPATGSEMNGTAVISRIKTGDKISFRSPLVKPLFSVLDPTTTYSLPARQTANGVVDAFAHTFEQYATYPVGAKVQDRFAEGVFLTLIEDGPIALADPKNYQVRANIMWSATMALNGILGVGVPQDWTSHAIGHELTALYGLDHGQALAIIIPALMKRQKNVKKEKLLQLARRVWQYQGQDDEAALEFCIEKTQAFFEQMGIKTKLSDYGIDDSQFNIILTKIAQHKGTQLGEHKDIDLQVVKEILYLAL